jgi:hypothetical protein
MRPHVQSFVLASILLSLSACSRLPPTGSAAQPFATKDAATKAPTAASADSSLNQLFSHVWRVTKAPSPPAAGGIFIFLPDGTVLETSCVETYRIAAWTIAQESPRELRVVEDRQLAYTATIAELTDTTLRLQQHLARSKEMKDIALTAVEQEFVCPDMSK